MEDSIELTVNGTDCHITIHNIDSESDMERVNAILAAFRGADNEYADYFCYFYDDDLYQPADSVGSQNIIPEGKYKGFTVQDIYAINGHYSLSLLLQTVYKMMSVPFEIRRALYEEAVHFTVPLIRRKEIDLDDFISAYKPFLKGKGPTPDGDVSDWLKVPPDQQAIAYNELVENITRRMEKSLQPTGRK